MNKSVVRVLLLIFTIFLLDVMHANPDCKGKAKQDIRQVTKKEASIGPTHSSSGSKIIAALLLPLVLFSSVTQGVPSTPLYPRPCWPGEEGVQRFGICADISDGAQLYDGSLLPAGSQWCYDIKPDYVTEFCVYPNTSQPESRCLAFDLEGTMLGAHAAPTSKAMFADEYYPNCPADSVGGDPADLAKLQQELEQKAVSYTKKFISKKVSIFSDLEKLQHAFKRKTDISESTLFASKAINKVYKKPDLDDDTDTLRLLMNASILGKNSQVGGFAVQKLYDLWKDNRTDLSFEDASEFFAIAGGSGNIKALNILGKMYKDAGQLVIAEHVWNLSAKLSQLWSWHLLSLAGYLGQYIEPGLGYRSLEDMYRSLVPTKNTQGNDCIATAYCKKRAFSPQVCDWKLVKKRCAQKPDTYHIAQEFRDASQPTYEHNLNGTICTTQSSKIETTIYSNLSNDQGLRRAFIDYDITPMLVNMVTKLARRFNLPFIPWVFMHEDQGMPAGQHLSITTTEIKAQAVSLARHVLEHYSDRQIEELLGHELGHAYQYGDYTTGDSHDGHITGNNREAEADMHAVLSLGTPCFAFSPCLSYLRFCSISEDLAKELRSKDLHEHPTGCTHKAVILTTYKNLRNARRALLRDGQILHQLH